MRSYVAPGTVIYILDHCLAAESALPLYISIHRQIMLLSTAFLAYVASTLAADQSPPVAFALTQQYRPDTRWRSCNSTGDARANCGFCYGSGDTFLGWNCNCDKFVSFANGRTF